MEDEIGERMKVYEKGLESSLNNTLPFIVRLDGHRFSKFTKGFKKPFDERIYTAMIRTTADLLRDFSPTLAYTQSDEITLVFMPQLDENNNFKNYIFNGRVQKIVSLLAGFTSSRFTYHLSHQTYDVESEQNLIDKISMAYFDGRIFNLPDESEVLYNIVWRLTDAKRNSKNNLGHIHLTQKEVEGLPPGEILKKLEVLGVDWYSFPGAYKWGSFLKKSQYEKESENPKTGEKVKAIRTRIMISSFDLRYTEEGVSIISQRLTNDTIFHDKFEPLDYE